MVSTYCHFLYLLHTLGQYLIFRYSFAHSLSSKAQILPHCEFLNKQCLTLDTICYFFCHAVYINMQATMRVACIFIDSMSIKPTNAQYLMLTLFFSLLHSYMFRCGSIIVRKSLCVLKLLRLLR